MGKLCYGDAATEIEFDDRVLTHLQIVIGAKLRRGESFFFSWKDDPAIGDGRSSVWLDSSVPLFFRYASASVPTVNRDWITLLTASANSGAGLTYLEEPPTAGG